ncbi:SDR family oxidoreductase [Leifsonia sp. Leaf264]|uniref:SDR family oxidoreductase n=1 Tax=Leifsonia sp. Leaf264 TaxID=1736314 RepID=UPI0006FC7768|nr:SDR family oxidoreductase [Leifsonia sp. Leaf264]KQO97473.1 short-chain dehydrogenase [Leifsonia sp. Leaf264]
MPDVLVVIGAGGMGETIARRLAPGKLTLLADFNTDLLARVSDSMTTDGFTVETAQVDVSSRESVEALARRAHEAGSVSQMVHTAGVSPTQAPLEAVLKVDLLGVALMIEAFGAVIAPGGSGVVISSSSSYLTPNFTPDQAQAIRSSTPEGLLELPFFAPEVLGHAGIAYGLSKQANRIQVQAASGSWGARGARINSVSPGVISTAMGRLELESPSGAFMRAMVENSGSGRIGTPSDIADAVTFLVGPQATYITGIDLLVDGGNVAAVVSGRVPLPTR